MNNNNLLLSSNFIKLSIGGLTSSIGFWIQIVLILIIMYKLTESPFQVSFANIMWSLPWSIFGGFIGTLSSKYNNKQLMIVGRTISIVAITILFIFSITENLSVNVVYITLFLHGIGTVIDFPSRRMLMLDILGREFIVRGNAIESFLWQLSKLIGPLLAGLFLIYLSDSYGILLMLGFLTIPLITTIMIKYTPPETDITKSEKVTIKDYYNLIKNNKIVLVICSGTIIMNLFMFPQQSMTPFIAVDVLGRSSSFSSIIIAVEAVGAMITAILLFGFNIKKIGLIFALFSGISLFGLFIYSFSENYILSLGIILFVGLGIAGFGATQASVVQLSTNRKERPLAMGLLSICIGSSPIGSFLYGTIAENYGAQLTVRFLPVSGLIILIIVILITNIIHKVSSDNY
ncbi:MAG TPA: MFS transporter [Dehalococcoidia bacterium]|nr:MFS transporter [Dehalococcoidia bacterium]